MHAGLSFLLVLWCLVHTRVRSETRDGFISFSEAFSVVTARQHGYRLFVLHASRGLACARGFFVERLGGVLILHSFLLVPSVRSSHWRSISDVVKVLRAPAQFDLRVSMWSASLVSPGDGRSIEDSQAQAKFSSLQPFVHPLISHANFCGPCQTKK